jgi:hypothetical protein
MTFYHGTTSNALPAIRQHGLTPQDEPQSAMRGNMSTIPGYTERMVFLAPVAREAWFYAREQAEAHGGKPVVLAVTVHPSDPLRVSDDYILTQIFRAICQAHDLSGDLEYDEDGDVPPEYDDNNELYHIWREILSHPAVRTDLYAGRIDQAVQKFLPDAIYHLDGEPAEIEQHLAKILEIAYQTFQEAKQAPWRASIATDRDPAVAFEGTIPPDRIQILEPKAVTAAKRAYTQKGRGFGNPADWGLPPEGK